MTGVQTCALPICSPLDAIRNDPDALYALLSKMVKDDETPNSDATNSDVYIYIYIYISCLINSFNERKWSAKFGYHTAQAIRIFKSQHFPYSLFFFSFLFFSFIFSFGIYK